MGVLCERNRGSEREEVGSRLPGDPRGLVVGVVTTHRLPAAVCLLAGDTGNWYSSDEDEGGSSVTSILKTLRQQTSSRPQASVGELSSSGLGDPRLQKGHPTGSRLADPASAGTPGSPAMLRLPAGQAQVTPDPLTHDWLAPYPAPSPTVACIPALPVPGAPKGLGHSRRKKRKGSGPFGRRPSTFPWSHSLGTRCGTRGHSCSSSATSRRP